VEGADKISFNTPALALENAQVVWTMPDEVSRNVVPQLDLFFNYKIDPVKLKEKLIIEVDERKHHLLKQFHRIQKFFQACKFQAGRPNYETKLQLGKAWCQKEENSIESITEQLSVPSPYVLAIQNVESEHDGTEKFV
jgi:hypothetical protein